MTSTPLALTAQFKPHIRQGLYVVFVGFDACAKSSLGKICKKFGKKALIFQAAAEILKIEKLPSVCILVLDHKRNLIQSKTLQSWCEKLGAMRPIVIVGGPELTQWSLGTIPPCVKRLVVFGGSSKELEGKLINILASLEAPAKF